MCSAARRESCFDNGFPRAALAWIACALSAGCASDATAPTVAGSPRVATFAAISSDPVVATALSLSATLTDSAGRVVRNQVVNFVVTRGGGSVFSPAVESSPTGRVTNQWTLGVVADSQSVEVRWIEPLSGALRSLGALTLLPIHGPVNPLQTTLARFGGLEPAASPARFPANALVDIHGVNLIPYRIPADGRLNPQGSVPGTESAHIVTFTAAAADGVEHSVALLGVGDAPVATLVYRVSLMSGTPMIRWEACGLAVASCSLPP